MAEYTVLECDVCSKKAKKHEAENWLRVEIVGIDAWTFEDKRYDGIYCGPVCAAKQLTED